MTAYLLTIGVVLFELACALDITFFVMLYFPLDLTVTETFLNRGNIPQGALVVFFSLPALVVLLLLKKPGKAIWPKDKKFTYLLIGQGTFSVVAVVKYLSFHMGLRYHILALISAGLAIYLLFRIGGLLYQSAVAAWRHPTTTGYVLVSGLIMAIGVTILAGTFPDHSRLLLIILALLLILEIFILYARFRFLTQSSRAVKHVAAKLLSENILIFGGYIIAGIFIPLVFISFTLWIQPVSEQGIAVLVILGALFERYLFFTAPPEAKNDYK